MTNIGLFLLLYMVGSPQLNDSAPTLRRVGMVRLVLHPSSSRKRNNALMWEKASETYFTIYLAARQYLFFERDFDQHGRYVTYMFRNIKYLTILSYFIYLYILYIYIYLQSDAKQSVISQHMNTRLRTYCYFSVTGIFFENLF